MNKEKIESLFELELKQIKNPILHDIILSCYEKLDDIFFDIPSSSTGKYHPEVCNRKHGLVMHIKLVFAYAKILIEATFKYYEINERTNIQDLILTAILLHDISKRKYYKKYSDYENHPITSSNIVKDVIYSIFNGHFNLYENDNITIKDTEQLLDMIKNHMGIYTPKEYEKPIENYTLSELIVYYSDILSSQRNQNHLPYIEEMYLQVKEILA
jgi:hypothetical protein